MAQETQVVVDWTTQEVPKKRFTQSPVFPWLVVLVIIIILLAIFSPFAIVTPGHRGIVTFFGDMQSDVLGEGFHVKYPLERVHRIDVRTQKVEVDADAVTQDLQTADVTVALNYHLDPEEVGTIYQSVGLEYEDTIIRPMVEESVKAAVAQFNVEELVAKRSDVVLAIQTDLENHLFDRHIIVEDIAITNFSFSDEVTQANADLEAARQAALAAAQDLKRAKTEVERINILGDALKGNEAYIEYELVQKWDGKSPLYLAPTSPVQIITDNSR